MSQRKLHDCDDARGRTLKTVREESKVTPPRNRTRHPQRSLDGICYYHMNKPRAIGERWKAVDIKGRPARGFAASRQTRYCLLLARKESGLIEQNWLRVDAGRCDLRLGVDHGG